MGNCGLVSISFRDKTPEEIVAAMQKCQLSNIEWGSDVHAPIYDVNKLKKISLLCKNNNINISSYGSYFRVGKNNPQELQEYINAAKLLGTRIIRIWCGTKGYKQYSNKELDGIISECKEIAAVAKKNGVTVCMECHNETGTDCAEGALTLMKEVDCESFRMYWQPNQYKTVEENIKYAELIAPYTKIIHVFNWSGNEKYPLGGAIGIWREYLNFFSKDIPLLLEFMPDGKIESLEQEAKSLYYITEN